MLHDSWPMKPVPATLAPRWGRWRRYKQRLYRSSRRSAGFLASGAGFLKDFGESSFCFSGLFDVGEEQVAQHGWAHRSAEIGIVQFTSQGISQRLGHGIELGPLAAQSVAQQLLATLGREGPNVKHTLSRPRRI